MSGGPNAPYGAVAVVARFWRDRRGVSALEFALIVPLLVLFSAATLDASRLIMLTHKLQNAAFTLADLSARIDDRKTNQLGHVLLAVDQVMKPFAFAARGRAIVTGVESKTADNTPTVAWQCRGAGGYDATSAIGQPSKAALLPAGLDMRKGESVISAEVFFDFRPLFGIGLPGPRVIRQVAYARPRIGGGNLACPEA